MVSQVSVLKSSIRALLIAVALGSVAPAVADEAEKTAPPARIVRLPAATVIAADRRVMTARTEVNGSLVARETVSIMPQVTGYQIVEIGVDVGSKVEKGQVILRLDAKPLETQLRQAEAAIVSAEAAIEQGRSQIEGQQATLTKAEASLSRARRLVESGAGTQSTLDDAESTYKGANSSLKGARDSVASAEAQRDQAVAKRADVALQLSRTTLAAPVAGIVASRNANIGQNAGTSDQPLFTLIENGEIEFEGQIIETALAEVSVGQEASIRPSGREPRAGSVRLISPSVDPKTRLGTIRIALDDDANLPIGIFASARVKTAERETVAVPLSAIVAGPKGNTVQVVGRDGVIDVRDVRTGIVEGDMVEVAEGLGAGETVVAKSGPFFRKGMSIRPVPIKPAPAPARELSGEAAELVTSGASRASGAGAPKAATP